MGDVAQSPEIAGIKEAADAARRFLFDLREAGLLGVNSILDVVVEEVEQTPEGDWLITLGYRQPSPIDSLKEGTDFLAAMRPRRSEFFRRFRVNRAGQVLAMHLREPARG